MNNTRAVATRIHEVSPEFKVPSYAVFRTVGIAVANFSIPISEDPEALVPGQYLFKVVEITHPLVLSLSKDGRR